MTKQEFLMQLSNRLSGLPQDDIAERLAFYSEMIDDRMEDGLSEDAAVSEIGSVDKIATQIVSDIPFTKLAKEKIKPKRALGAWEIVLLVLGSPIWLSLLIAAFAVFFSLYAVLWSVIISIWAVEVSLLGSSFGVIFGGIGFAVCGNTLTGIAMIGAGIFCAGLSVFMFFGCKSATKGTLLLTKKIGICIKKCFIKKEAV